MYNFAAVHEGSLAAGVIYVNICLGKNESLEKALRRKERIKGRIISPPASLEARRTRSFKRRGGGIF